MHYNRLIGILLSDTFSLFEAHLHTLFCETERQQILTEGLIRFISVSHFSLSQLKPAKKYAPVIAFQNQYNLLSREVETELLPLIEQQDIYFLSDGSLAYGILTGIFPTDKNHRWYNHLLFIRYFPTDKNYRCYEPLLICYVCELRVEILVPTKKQRFRKLIRYHTQNSPS